MKKEAHFEDDDKFPTISLNRNAAPFIPHGRERQQPQFREYKENESKLLANLTKIYTRNMAEEAEQLMLDYYEGSSEEAIQLDGFESSSVQAMTA